MPSLLGKVSALPTEEVIAFPFGEGGGFADGRGLYGNKCSHLSEFIIFSPQSGKTFNDISVKRDPLSALRATLPEGESFYAGWENYLFYRLGFKTSAIIAINYKYLQKSGYKPIKAVKRQAKTSEIARKTFVQNFDPKQA